MLGGFVALFRHETDEKRDWREWGKGREKMTAKKKAKKRKLTYLPKKKKQPKQTEKQYITSLYV